MIKKFATYINEAIEYRFFGIYDDLIKYLSSNAEFWNDELKLKTVGICGYLDTFTGKKIKSKYFYTKGEDGRFLGSDVNEFILRKVGIVDLFPLTGSTSIDNSFAYVLMSEDEKIYYITFPHVLLIQVEKQFERIVTPEDPYDGFDYDPEEILPLVGLPSGEYIEIKRKNYGKIQRIATWSERLHTYTFRDKDYKKLLYLLDMEELPGDDTVRLAIANKLKELKINNEYKIEKERIIIYGNLNLRKHLFWKLPIKIYEVHGNLDISQGFLETLENLPRIVHGNFNCNNNRLKSLEKGPREVEGSYNCSYNTLTSLIGSPIETGNFDCSHNKLEVVEYCPSVVNGDFNCSYNDIEHILDSPISVTGIFDCSNNPRLTNYKGIPKDVKSVKK